MPVRDIPKILVDTDVLINFLRGVSEAKGLLEEAARTADLFLSVITLAELLAGMRPSEKPATEALTGGMTLLPVNESVARRAGALRRQGASRVALPDCLIAATALEEDCSILTSNRRHYAFPGLRFFSPPPLRD